MSYISYIYAHCFIDGSNSLLINRFNTIIIVHDKSTNHCHTDPHLLPCTKAIIWYSYSLLRVNLCIQYIKIGSQTFFGILTGLRLSQYIIAVHY
jgi:hypothetical protein